jgi:ubiquinone/menaquinone biosynthesis C-methylase UbiE
LKEFIPMVNDLKSEKENILAANIAVHTAISEEYNTDSHWRPENIKKVRDRILKIVSRLPDKNRVLDMGCGTGFLINLTHDLFKRVDGIDITDAMTKQVDLSPGNIYISNQAAENTTFEDNLFDLITAYSFLDHAFSLEDILKEAYRLLKTGGYFYADLNPNRQFWSKLKSLDSSAEYSAAVQREVDALNNGDTISNTKGLDKQTMELAEPGKAKLNGFDRNEVISLAKKLGFKEVKVEYDWFLGEAQLIHSASEESRDIVDTFLNNTLPLSAHFFKYLRFEFKK